MDDTRINEKIRAREVRLIGAEGEHFGVIQTRDALAKAQEVQLDLVEISDKSTPPVCRIMDYGQFRYQKAKKQKDSRKKLKKIVVKEVKFRPRIGDHDYWTKVKHAKEFLRHGDKVKFLVQFRGRENAHREIGAQILQRVVGDLEGIATVESAPRQEGHFMNMVMAPDAAMLRQKAKEQAKSEQSEAAGSKAASKRKDEATAPTAEQQPAEAVDAQTEEKQTEQKQSGETLEATTNS